MRKLAVSFRNYQKLPVIFRKDCGNHIFLAESFRNYFGNFREFIFTDKQFLFTNFFGYQKEAKEREKNLKMSDRIYDTNGKEVSVAWAAKRIRCSERSILYYLKERKLDGIKVGKSWFIDRASVEAHCTRYGIAEPEDMKIPDPPSDSDIIAVEIQASAAPSQENSTEQSSPSNIPSNTSSTGYNGKRRRPPKPITTLNVYKLFEQAIREAQSSLNQDEKDPCMERIFNLQLSALEGLGGGYYSQNRDIKLKKYSEARSCIGAILSILHSCCNITERMKGYIKQIEEEVLPALSALIRYIELDKGNKNKSRFRDNDRNDNQNDNRPFYDGGSDRS